jgi:hypothetical protein
VGDAREVDRVTDFGAWVVIRSVVGVEIEDCVDTSVWARLCGAVDVPLDDAEWDVTRG